MPQLTSLWVSLSELVGEGLWVYQFVGFLRHRVYPFLISLSIVRSSPKAICFTLKSAVPHGLLISLSILDFILLSYFAVLMRVKWYCIVTICSLLIVHVFTYFLHDVFKVFSFINYLFISFEYFSVCFPLFCVDLLVFLTYCRYSPLTVCYRCSKYILTVSFLSIDCLMCLSLRKYS